MNHQRGFVFTPLMLLALKGVAIAAAVFVGYQYIDNNWATDAGVAKGKAIVQKDYDEFVLSIKLEGVRAQTAAAFRVASEKLDKEKKDAALKTLRGALAAADANLVRERSARASGGYLPPASPKASDPSRATLDRAKFESAMGLLDERGAGIAKAGDDYRVGLDSLKTE